MAVLNPEEFGIRFITSGTDLIGATVKGWAESERNLYTLYELNSVLYLEVIGVNVVEGFYPNPELLTNTCFDHNVAYDLGIIDSDTHDLYVEAEKVEHALASKSNAANRVRLLVQEYDLKYGEDF